MSEAVDDGDDDAVDAVLPAAVVESLMRQWLPADAAAVSGGSRELMRTCVVELIAFVTSEACDLARQEHRTTLTGDDIVRAAARLGFDDYVAPLTQFMNAYRARLAPPAVYESAADAPDDVLDVAAVDGPLLVPSTDAAEFVDVPPPDLGDDE